MTDADSTMGATLNTAAQMEVNQTWEGVGLTTSSTIPYLIPGAYTALHRAVQISASDIAGRDLNIPVEQTGTSFGVKSLYPEEASSRLPISNG